MAEEDTPRPVHRWSDKAKKYRLIGRQHTGFNEAGTSREEYEFGDEVMLEPNDYKAFADKFEPLDTKKSKAKKSAADIAFEENEKMDDEVSDEDELATQPVKPAPITAGSGDTGTSPSGQGPSTGGVTGNTPGQGNQATQTGHKTPAPQTPEGQKKLEK